MIWRGVGIVAAIALLGATAGHVATADNHASRAFRTGGATVTLEGDRAALDALHVTLRPSFTPPGGEPKATRLAGYAATAYGSVTVLPTTRGLLECDCTRAIRSLSVAGAAVLAPAPDLALRLRAPAALAALDATRVRARASWTDASARRLAAAHRTALAALDPVAGPDLVRALSGAADAYDRLATTPTARDEVIAADRAVDAAVAALARAGAPAVQRPAAPAPTGGGVSALTLLLVLAAALVLSALASGFVRRVRARRAPVGAAKPCLLAPLRRTPIAPPPTYGRWDEAPRGPGAAATEDGDARAPVMASSSTT